MLRRVIPSLLMNSIDTRPTPPTRLSSLRKWRSVIPAIGARINGGSIGIGP